MKSISKYQYQYHTGKYFLAEDMKSNIKSSNKILELSWISKDLRQKYCIFPRLCKIYVAKALAMRTKNV